MTRALGIDIGQRSIKIAEIEYTSKSRELVGLYQISRNPDQQVADQIKEFLQSSQVKAERIAMGLSDAPIFYKRLQFPFSDPKKYTPAVYSDLEDSLPFDLSDYVLDIKRIGKIGKLSQFLVGICPRKWVDTLNTVAEVAGLVPNFFLLDSQAMGEMALHQGLAVATDESSYMIVDFGYEITKIAIMKGFQKDPHDKNIKAPVNPGMVADFRSFHHGSHELTKWIQERKNINFEDAEQWLIHRAEIKLGESTDAVAADLSDELKVALRPFIVEIYQAMQSFKGTYKGHPACIYLTGGMSSIRGLKEFIADELRTPVSEWGIFAGYKTDNVPLSSDKELSFAAALALANSFVLSKTSQLLNFRRSQGASKKVLSSYVEAAFRKESAPLWITSLGLTAFLVTYNLVASHYLGEERKELIKVAATEYRRIDRDAGKTADRLAETLIELRKRFEEKKKVKLKELSSREIEQKGVPKSQLLLDLSLAMTTTSKVSSFTSRGSGSPKAEFEAIIALNQSTSETEIETIKGQIEKPLKDKGYTVSIKRIDNSKTLKINATIEGTSL